jgi:hypothetical protein
MTKHSKYYYDYERNMDTTANINPKMKMSKEDLGLDSRVPEYYIGDNGYMAKDVVANFDLTYNLGTACTYILRAYRKHKTPVDCIKKAIAHLNFELEKYEKTKNSSMCQAEDDQGRQMETKKVCS